MRSAIDRLFAREILRAPAAGPKGTLGTGVVTAEMLRDGAVASDIFADGAAPSFATLAALTADTTVTAGAALGSRVRLEQHSSGAGSPTLLEAVPAGTAHVVGASNGGAVNWRVTGPEADVRMWGARGDGVADDRAAIQAAEDACAALAAERGGRMTLRFPAGTYAIGDTVQKRGRVDWRLAGEIRRADATAPVPTGVQYALVLAQNIDDWSIVGGAFRAITHRKVDSVALPRKNGNNNPGNINACIHVTSCKNWRIADASFRDYSSAIVYQGCANFRIHGNEMEDGSGETIASMLDGTFAPTYTYTGTGAIIQSYIASGPSAPSSNFAITNNVIRNPGLDVAIEALNQSYDAQPGLVANNVIFGSRSGIQAYRGSFPDPGNAPTFEARLLIQGNFIYATWEQGIYLRAVTGVRCAGNIIHYPGLVGSNGSGSSAGGIVTRVNPFNPAASYPSAATLSDRAGIEIEGNVIQNSGRPGATSDGAIQIRIPNTRVRGNRVVRDDKRFTSREGVAIAVGSGELTGPFTVEDNEIVNYAIGVQEANITTAAPGYGAISISRNRIMLITTAIEIDGRSPIPRRIDSNDITDFGKGIRLRSAPFAVVSRNIMSKGSTGIEIQSGCLASDVVGMLTAGAKSASSRRRGGTVTVHGNDFRDVATAHAIAETSGVDNSFHGRCAVWRDDVVNGARVDPEVFATATPPSSANARTWHVGDRVRNTTNAAGTVYEKVCTAPGTYRATGTTTGATSAGSAVVSSIADWSGIGPGVYLSVGGTVVRVVSVNPGGDSFTADKTFAATASGVTIDRATPTFINLYSTGAT